MPRKKQQVDVERVGKRRVNLRPSEWEALRQLAFDDRTTISEQIRRAVDKYVRWRQAGRNRKRKGEAA
jgi:hypothetical protein